MSGRYESRPEAGIAEEFSGTWLSRATWPEFRSRRKLLSSAPPVCPGKRLGALLSKATQRPSALTEACKDVPAAVSEGGWFPTGREMACRVEDNRQRVSNGSTARRQVFAFLPGDFAGGRPRRANREGFSGKRARAQVSMGILFRDADRLRSGVNAMQGRGRDLSPWPGNVAMAA